VRYASKIWDSLLFGGADTRYRSRQRCSHYLVIHIFFGHLVETTFGVILGF
jgi:hypothetical protein